MVVANPLNEFDDLLGDNNDTDGSTQEEELGSDPSDSEGASTQPTENLTQKEDTTQPTKNLTQKEDTSQRTTNPVGREASKA